MLMENLKDKIAYIGIMALYGTTGIIKKFIPFSSSFISFTRAVIALALILLVLIVKKKRIDFKGVKRNLPYLTLVGLLLGLNWIAYFEACNYTTVAKASLCYYMAPVIIIALSPILYKEKLGVKKLLCVLAAVIGMVMVSGVLTDSTHGDGKGIAIGLGAAMIYALVIIFSRKITDIPSYDKTAIQMAVAAMILLPGVLTNGEPAVENATVIQWILLIVIGAVNTGIAYIIYFDKITKLKAQTIAIFAYADPVVSVLLSALILKEPLGIYGIMGAVLIIGAMVINELG